jgi:hypothetical protein
LNDDVPIVSESSELFLSRFHALTIPEIGPTRPNRIAAAIRTYRHLRGEDEAETGGLRNSQPSTDLLALAENCPDGRNCHDQPD